MTLSLCMIAKNEDAHLGHCLASVGGLVDELVVVDTGSTDRTVEVARAAGARLGSFPWCGDFSAARNASLDLASGDWALVLDADEALDPADFDRIRAAMAAPGAQAYRLLVRSYLPGGAYTMMETQAKANPGGYQEGKDYAHCADTRALRLFRRHPWARFRHRIHEMVDPCFQERGLAAADLDAVIHHYGYTLAARVEAKKPFYLDLARRDAEDDPGDLQGLFHLVIQAAAAEDWGLTLGSADRYCDLAAARRLQPPATVRLARALALQRLERFEEALAAFRQLPGNVPAQAGAGVCLERLGRLPEARAALERCCREHPDYTTSFLDLADLHVRAGDPGQARTVLGRGLEVSPGDPGLWGRLIRLGLDQGPLELAVQDAWAALQACPAGGAGEWHKLVGVFLLRQGAADQGRRVLALGLQAFPGDPALTRLLETT